MPQITIDPKHARLQAFLAGKGINESNQPATLEVSDTELSSLLRKAKNLGFEDCFEVSKGAKKTVKKVEEPIIEEVADETPTEQPITEGEEATPKRRRRTV